MGALTGANKRLGQLVGLVALTLGNVQYTLGQLGIYVAAAIEYPVDGAAAGARFSAICLMVTRPLLLSEICIALGDVSFVLEHELTVLEHSFKIPSLL